MKKMLANFGNEILNRSQMIGIKGGMCRIVLDSTSGTCGNTTVLYGGTQAQAVAYGDNLVASGGYSGYNITCDTP